MPSDQRFINTVGEIAKLTRGGRMPPPVEPGSPDDDDPAMEARLKRVEDDVREVGARMNAVESRRSALEAKVEALVREIASLNATLRTKVAGPWQTFGLALGLLTASLTLPTVIARLLALLP